MHIPRLWRWWVRLLSVGPGRQKGFPEATLKDNEFRVDRQGSTKGGKDLYGRKSDDAAGFGAETEPTKEEEEEVNIRTCQDRKMDEEQTE